jgi:hypothetical protein
MIIFPEYIINCSFGILEEEKWLARLYVVYGTAGEKIRWYEAEEASSGRNQLLHDFFVVV